MPDPATWEGVYLYVPVAVVVALAGAFGYYRKKKNQPQ